MLRHGINAAGTASAHLQQHQRQPGLGGQQQADPDIHGHPSEDTKKRQGDALLPAENSQNSA